MACCAAASGKEASEHGLSPLTMLQPKPIVVQHNHGVDPDKEEVRVIGVVLTSYRDHRRPK